MAITDYFKDITTVKETSSIWSTDGQVTSSSESVTSPAATSRYSNYTYDPFDYGGGLVVHTHWRKFDIFGLPEIYHYAMGAYATIICIIGFIGNIITIWIFSSVKKLRTPPNMFIINLAISDGTFSLVNGFPLWSISSFQRRWVFGKLGCVAYGFVGGLAGFVSINTLTFIAIDRYYVIARPFSALKNITHRRAAIQIAFIWLWSLAWSGPPLLGWGAYILEGFQTTCSFDYLTRTPWNISYVISIFVCEFIAPVFAIAVCYVNIVLAVSNQNKAIAKKTEQLSAKEKKDQKKNKQEIQLAKTAAITIVLFLVSWIPYSSVAVMGISGYTQHVTPVTALLPVMFAKASAIYNPILYALTHPKFRRALHERIPCLFLCCPNIDIGDRSESSAQSHSTSRQDRGSKFKGKDADKKNKKDGGGGGKFVRQSTRDSINSEFSVLEEPDSMEMSNVPSTNNTRVSSDPAGQSMETKNNRSSKKVVKDASASVEEKEPTNQIYSPNDGQQIVAPQVMILNTADPTQYPVYDPNMQLQPGQQPYVMYYPPNIQGSPGQAAPSSPQQYLPSLGQTVAPPGMMPPCNVYTVLSSPETHANVTGHAQELKSQSNKSPSCESRESDSNIQETSFSGADKTVDNKEAKEEGVCNRAFENE